MQQDTLGYGNGVVIGTAVEEDIVGGVGLSSEGVGQGAADAEIEVLFSLAEVEFLTLTNTTNFTAAPIRAGLRIAVAALGFVSSDFVGFGYLFGDDFHRTGPLGS